MATQIVDRRQNGRNKSAVNRERFVARYKSQIKKAVEEAIEKRSITNIESGEKIVIPAKDIREPFIHYGQGGKNERVLPGNEEFLQGDKLQRPSSGSGQGSGGQAGNSGEGNDDFIFNISREEFLDIYFEDLALPELVKKNLHRIPTFKMVRAGYTTTGIPTNINIVRSLKGALSRRIAAGGTYYKKLHVLEQQLTDPNLDVIEKKEIQAEIEKLKHKILIIPFIDTFDLRFNHRIKQHMPTTQAVMFCIMDVSGSMDKVKKDIAKRFFILLYLFLKRNYEKIDVVFIRHHTSAKEVTEEEFFYSRETGGTVVSSSLQLMKKIMTTRYDPLIWNIYAAQASDGDNWNADSPVCRDILSKEIMHKLQYFAYVEIMPRIHQSLWESYQGVKEEFPSFAMQTINELADIYPVFRELFKRKTT
jgi:uncharacterized protein